MGHCVGKQKSKSALALCRNEPATMEFFSAEELRALGEITQAWSKQKIQGEVAKQQLLERVFRGQTQLTLGVQSSLEAASQAGFGGAFMGAAAGSNATSQGSSVLGALAGGLLGGLGAALLGGAQAGMRSQQVFRFVDRIFLQSTLPEAWELAAQHLEIEGARPAPSEIQSQWLLKARAIMDPMQRSPDGGCEIQTPQSVWLRLTHLCFSAEILRHVAAPDARRSLPAELPPPPGVPGENAAGMPFRMDPEFLGRRVQALLLVLATHAMAEDNSLTPAEIAQRCPSETLAQASEDTCPVCLESYVQGAMVRRLPCNHILHAECCDAWLQTADTCAMCRHPVREPYPPTHQPSQPNESSQPRGRQPNEYSQPSYDSFNYEAVNIN